MLVVRKDFPANNLKEFVAYAKSNPDKLNVGHAGLGSVSYIGCLLLHAAIGIKPTMIPFTGTAPVLNAMLGGQVDYECDPVLGTLSQVQAGNVKALAVAARKRSPLLPDVPTSHEQGLPEFDIAPFYAVFVPSGTPQAVVEKLADALNKGLNEEAVQKRLADLGADSVEPGRRGPKALADLVKSEDRTADANSTRRGGEISTANASLRAEYIRFRRDRIDIGWASAPTNNQRERARSPMAARRGAPRCPPAPGSAPDKAS